MSEVKPRHAIWSVIWLVWAIVVAIMDGELGATGNAGIICSVVWLATGYRD